MSLWFAAYCPSLEPAKNDPSIRVEVPRYRVYPADGSDRWIAETNTGFSRELTDAFRSVHVMASKGQCQQPFFLSCSGAKP